MVITFKCVLYCVYIRCRAGIILHFPLCPHSRLIIWSRETNSAVSSRVRPLNLHTRAESGASLRPAFRDDVYLESIPSTAIGSDVPSFVRSRNGLSMTFSTNPSRETKSSGANGGRETSISPVQLTTSRIGNLTRLIHTLAICATIHTYHQAST